MLISILPISCIFEETPLSSADSQPFLIRSFLLFLGISLLPLSTAAQNGAESGASAPLLLADNSTSAPIDAVRVALSEPKWPEGLLLWPSSERYLLWVELEEGWLKVLERRDNGGLVMRRQVPVSIGKMGIGKTREGDQKTPAGIYRITSFLSDIELDDFYGQGAYPLNYPNSLDRLQGRTGHGIWLHGLPKGVDSRPYLDSDGYIVIDNENLQAIAAEIDPGRTSIILSPVSLNWISAESGRQKSEALMSELLA